MKKINKFISAVLSFTAIAATFSCVPSISANDISVEFDGKVMNFDVSPQIINGRTMVPLRAIFEETGALIKWDNDTKSVQARKNSKTLTLKINSDELSIDKGKVDADGNPVIETVGLEVPAQIISGRVLVPISAISEALGFNVSWNEDEKKVTITSDNDDDDSWKENVGTVNLSDLTYTGSGIEIQDKRILITEGGDFTLNGTLSDGNIEISTEEKVKLRLSGADITSLSGPCIFAENADKVYITVTKDTKNVLVAENSEDGAIYSKDNLEIKGEGTLEISSRAGHAIKASDNLTIENGNINISAFGDGIHVNDTFKMSGGNVSIESEGDGIESESIVIISGGSLNITTTGVPVNVEEINKTEENTGNPSGNMPHGGMMEENNSAEFEKSSKGIKGDWMISISAGEININSASHAVHCQDEIEITGGIFNIVSEYGKGITAHGNLTVSNSETVINIQKSTEGLESKKTAVINDGSIKINSSDDGINATGGRSGEMPGTPPMGMRQDMQNIPENKDDEKDKFFEPKDMTDTEREKRRPERENNGMPPEMPENSDNRRPDDMHGGNRNGMATELSDCLVINGGDIEIFSGDDCLDSNGNLIINGGTIKAVKENGTFTGPNSVLDPDGKISIDDGVTLIAAGSGGTQGELDISGNSITIYSEQSHNSGEKISLKDKNGNIIAEYTPNGAYSAVLITSPKIEIGESYVINLGDEQYEIGVSEKNTNIGTQKNNHFDRNNFTPPEPR